MSRVGLIDLDILLYQDGYASDSQCKRDSNNNSLEFTVMYIDRHIKRIKEQIGADEVVLFMTGPTNFRKEIDSILPYKGNRNPDHKPSQYDAAKAYYATLPNTVVVADMEADDAMAITACQLARDFPDREIIICTQDKDLKTVPCTIYNWKDAVYENINPLLAQYFLHTQIMTGDTSDNIKGLVGVGPSTARSLLKNYQRICEVVLALSIEHNALIVDANSPFFIDYRRGIEATTLREYHHRGYSYLDFLETGNLVMIRKSHGDTYLPVKHKEYMIHQSNGTMATILTDEMKYATNFFNHTGMYALNATSRSSTLRAEDIWRMLDSGKIPDMFAHEKK